MGMEPRYDASGISICPPRTTDPLQEPIARKGEQQFAAIIRNRSGFGAGSIDMAVRSFEIEELVDCDQQDIVASALTLAEACIERCKPENRRGKQHLLDRLTKLFAQP